MTYSTADKLKCLRREIALRKSAYPKWVRSMKMTQENADHEIAVMQAIHDDVEEIPGIEEAIRELLQKTADVVMNGPVGNEIRRLRSIEEASVNISEEVRATGAPTLETVSKLIAALNAKDTK